MPEILLATTNPAKQRELRRLVDGLASVHPVTPRDLGLAVEAPEDGADHPAVAGAKALAWARAGGMIALASDGGLMIPALSESWESLYTRRFAGPVDDLARAEALLRRMEGLHGTDRQAYWREAAAIAGPEGVRATWEVEGAEGYLLEWIDPGRMVPGFWVSGLWYFPDLDKTYRELTDAERRQVDDHWMQLRARVQDFFNT